MADKKPSGAPAENESTDLRWLSPEQLKEVPSNLIFENVKEIGAYVFETCLKDWEPVSLERFDTL